MKVTLHVSVLIKHEDLLQGHVPGFDVTGDIETLAPRVATKLNEQLAKHLMKERAELDTDASRMKHKIAEYGKSTRMYSEAIDALTGTHDE